MIGQVLANGLVGGCIYILAAIGLTMIFSILRVPNLAHGTIYMWGAFVAYYLVTFFGFDFVTGTIFAAVIIAALGIFIEKIVFKPMRGASLDSVFLLSIGLMVFMENFALLIWGEQPRRIPAPFTETVIKIPGDVYIPALRLLMVVVVVSIVVVLHFFVKKTRIGKAMRAVQQDPVTSRLMGISINRIGSITFALGCALAAVAGALVGATFSLYFGMGSMVGVKSFIVIILGGLGSVLGTVVGGLFLGLTESFVQSYITLEYSNLAAFGILIAVLILKPEGLFGREKLR